MPTSPPSSNGSSPPCAPTSPAWVEPLEGAERPRAPAHARPARPPLRWRLNLVLFAATVLSVLSTGAEYVAQEGTMPRLSDGLAFAAALLGILVTHEAGHFVFARWRGVAASLPFFIPMPWSPFGTMGAVIVMRDRIKSRDALLDIGASGPIAGMIVAIPVLLWGLAHSEVHAVSSPGMQEGQSLLYLLLKRIVLGPIPDGHDVFLHPVAFAGWAGLFVTMLNLMPVWQLDGGHVAYALFGPRQNRIARVVRWSLLGISVYNLARWYGPIMASTGQFWAAVSPALMWLIWFGVLTAVHRFSRDGLVHPPTEPGTLSPRRRTIAIATMILFALLFMPTPMRIY